ncbi:PREDICTED: glu S.griseus protease inhibitor-like [Prunus mume]|uniref:Glu S.griseus protease inhibitor-like n=1 Tax=Prunus mume TaxID=102107 RepID=A0ABM0NGD6_PRUMU|nr:PREDICTED: glu S.griseus protease inhibitor-like [Prunus mume]
MASSTSTGAAAGKSSWPELVGTKGEEAVATIMKENPSLKAHTINQGSFITMDFRRDRVRVWIDEQGVVTAAPKIA